MHVGRVSFLGWLKQQKCVVSFRSHKPEVEASAGPRCLRNLEGRVLPASSCLWCSLAHGRTASVSASVAMGVSLHVCVFTWPSSYKDTDAVGLGPPYPGDCICQSPISKSAHILKLGLWGTQFNPHPPCRIGSQNTAGSE